MERWQFDLDRIRKNWERGPRVTTEQVAPPATGSPPKGTAGKFCATCGAELPADGSPHVEPASAGHAPAAATPEKTTPSATGSAPAEKIEPTAAGSAPATATAEKIAPTSDGSALLKLAEQPRSTVPSRFARVEAPRDPYPDAQALVARVRTLVHRQLASRESMLAPFLDKADDIVKKLAAKPGEEGDGPPVDEKKLRADLDRVLGDLEDMAALWSGIGR